MIDAKVLGVPDLKEALLGIAPKLRVRALRNALTAGARVVQKAARAAAPVLNPLAPAVLKGHRTSGLLRKQISVRTSKEARRQGNVGVFINVRPAKGAKFRTVTRGGVKSKQLVGVSRRGAKSPLDPYYWRFVNFGTKHMRGARFLEAGAEQLPEALKVFEQRIIPQINKLNRPKAPAP